MNGQLAPIIIPAILTDYPIIQKMWPFYVYDLSRECGFTKGWKCPIDPSFIPDDIIPYFNDVNKKSFLINVSDVLAGFIFINKLEVIPDIDFYLSEFFILAKFQNKGIGKIAAIELFNRLKGKWALGIIPENKKALTFWQKTIMAYTNGNFSEFFKTSEELKTDEHPEPHPMIMFSFDSTKQDQIIAENIVVRSAILADISLYVALSYNKRRAYEKAQPQFWKYAGAEAEISQTKWFEELLTDNDHIMLTAERNGKIVGFIIGRLISAPEVYNPGGLTLIIDDFCVEGIADWASTGHKLVQTIKTLSIMKGASQIIVVCGACDEPKRHLLKNMGLTVASQWYVGGVI